MWTSKRQIHLHSEIEAERPTRGDKILVIPTRNLILGSLPQFESNKLVDACTPVILRVSQEIYREDDQIEELFFPVECVASSVALLEDGSTVELSMTGREGIVGLNAIIGAGRSLHWTRISVPGAALRIQKAKLQKQFNDSEATQQAVLRAYRSQYTQVCQRSVCNTRHSLLQRLCVWLLMIHDRIGADELPFTQEDIASRISVRRAGVSVAASLLQSMHGISYHRGKIEIVDRYVIERSACECYKILGQEFHEERRRG